MSLLVELADAIVAELNGGEFSQAFTAERLYQPVFKLEDLAELKVSVVPKSRADELADRSSRSLDLAVDIGVQRKVDTDNREELDALMALVEEIGDFLAFRRPGTSSAMWIGVENEPVFDPEHLEKYRQFTSVLTVKYRARKRKDAGG